MPKQLKVTLVRSPIGIRPGHKKSLAALGLRKIRQSVLQPDNASTHGAVNKISYLLKVEPCD